MSILIASTPKESFYRDEQIPVVLSSVEMRFWVLREEHWQRYKVNWEVDMHDDGQVATFSCFGRSGFPGNETKGNGAKALTEVLALADEMKLNLHMWTVYEKLIPYYEGFDFIQTVHSGGGLWRFQRAYKQCSKNCTVCLCEK